jgi:hypothetical protein
MNNEASFSREEKIFCRVGSTSENKYRAAIIMLHIYFKKQQNRDS